jgi:hypothetical protein
MDLFRPIPFVVYALLVPACIAGVALLVARRSPQALRFVAALAIGVAFAIGHAINLGAMPSFPPAESTQSLFFVALAAALAGALRASARVPSALAWIAALAVAAGAPWLLLRNLMKSWSTLQSTATLAVVAVATLALTAACDAWAERRRGARFPLVGWLVATATAAAVGLTGSVKYAQFAATLAAVLGAAVVFAWVEREASFSRGATLVVAVLIAAIGVACTELAYLPRTSALLLLYAPLAAIAVDRGALAKQPGWKSWGIQLAAVALVLAIALAIAYRSQAATDTGY